jgi:hypothetical protein
MPKLTTTPFTQSIRNDLLVLSSGDGTIPNTSTMGLSPTNVFLLTSGAPNDSILKSIHLASNNTALLEIAFFISTDNGATDYLLGTARVAASGGFNGTSQPTDVLNSFILPYDNSGKRVLPMPSGTQVYAGVNITAGPGISPNKTVYIYAQVEDF